MNKEVWQLIEVELKTAFNIPVKALNLPGFGGEPIKSEQYDLDTVVQSVADKVNANSIVVGWSLGGLVATRLATMYPDKVAHLILVSSNTQFCEDGTWPGIKGQVLEQFKAQLAKDSKKTIERFLAIQAMGSEHAKGDIKQLKSLLFQAPEPQEGALSAGLDILQNTDLKSEFAKLRCPMNGIFGRLDALVPPAVAAEMANINPQFGYEILPQASHAPFISHRDEFINYLKSTL
ncbi:hypothetical protein N481_10680 [Pseudoalteromonas luteoviolacea S4047-1]|uniref:AB hydrolase-1 domain-containing protein n=2 Tax=Pseudoalteromonas luteoviolacea TaxID=43657 RepID=A0A0F6ADE7_9GAMM|nr:hypothetical protein N479_12575 [Pseudoalteromonas luteoviolacea S4054]KZN73896.1 hypothetical protein N481_10680 [Pseudoalteromonas luteoviolacea S4047-1]